jgi:hypothetical protein
MTPPANATSRKLTTGSVATWLIVFLLALIAARLWLVGPGVGWPELPAMAQNAPAAGARGIYAIPGQIGPQQWGLFMMDVDQGTFWVYGFDDVNGTQKLRLLAARTWVYDRYLQDYNCAEPGFRQVQQLISIQRTQPADKSPRSADALEEQPSVGTPNRAEKDGPGEKP